MTHPTHLLFVIHNLQGGGAEKVFTGLIRYFSERVKVSVLTFETGGVYEPEVNSLPIHRHIVLKPTSNPLIRVWEIRKILKQENPDKVISFLEYPNILTSWAAYGLGVPHISSERTNYLEYLGNSLKAKLKIQLLKGVFARAEKVITVSEALRENLIQYFGATKEKVLCIPNGIRFETLDQLSKETQANLTAPDSNTILAVGRLVKEKNYPLLLEAFQKAHTKAPHLKLYIAGDGPLKSNLMELSRQLNIQDALQMPGFVTNPALLMKQAGCFVLSSDLEGMPNALLEAMYLNGHVISTNCRTGPSEIISNRKDGILTPVGDADALANAILEMMENQALRQKYFEASRQSIQRFDQESIWKKWASVLLEA